jgi:hypothetical protein
MSDDAKGLNNTTWLLAYFAFLRKDSMLIRSPCFSSLSLSLSAFPPFQLLNQLTNFHKKDMNITPVKATHIFKLPTISNNNIVDMNVGWKCH